MRLALAIGLGMLTLAGCAHRSARVRVPPPPPPSTAPGASGAFTPGYTETGIASWYGHPYHGRPAADGEIYDMDKMTAAHRTLPFNTMVRVVNLGNDKSVDVRIIDRGPFVDGRIIDLSHAAARAIDMIGPGTATVRMQILSLPAPVGPGVFAVQVGTFRDRDNAERERARMAARYGFARLVRRDGNPVLWRVLVGSEHSEEGAGALKIRITQDSGERNAFVVRLDS